MRGVDAVDVESGIGLCQTVRCASASASANSAPCSVIIVRMELQVPLTMP